MRQLIPEPQPWPEPDLPALYAYPGHTRRWVRANMVASVDGLAQADGASRGLSGPADLRILRTLRGLADVVLVGGGTVRTEGYGRPAAAREEFAAARAAAGQPPAPAIAVVSASLELDFDSPLYTAAPHPDHHRDQRRRPGRPAGPAAGPARCWSPAATGSTWPRPSTGSPTRAAAVLLCEGGPRLLAGMAAAGRLDEVCLSVSPQLRGGDGLRILEGPALPAALALNLHTLLTQDGFLFARYLVV